MSDEFEEAVATNAEVAERAYDDGWKAALATLADHDRRIKAEALTEAAEALETKGTQYIEAADRYQGYYAGTRSAYQAAAKHLRTLAAHHVTLWPTGALPCNCEATEDHAPDQTKVTF